VLQTDASAVVARRVCHQHYISKYRQKRNAHTHAHHTHAHTHISKSHTRARAHTHTHTHTHIHALAKKRGNQPPTHPIIRKLD
jgi:hypothetical protein